MSSAGPVITRVLGSAAEFLRVLGIETKTVQVEIAPGLGRDEVRFSRGDREPLPSLSCEVQMRAVPAEAPAHWKWTSPLEQAILDALQRSLTMGRPFMTSQELAKITRERPYGRIRQVLANMVEKEWLVSDTHRGYRLNLHEPDTPAHDSAHSTPLLFEN